MTPQRGETIASLWEATGSKYRGRYDLIMGRVVFESGLRAGKIAKGLTRGVFFLIIELIALLHFVKFFKN